MPILTNVRGGANTLFWIDRWLLGQRTVDLAPQVCALVSKRIANKRTVQDALTSHSWVSDIQDALTVGVISEYLDLWDIIREVVLQPGVPDIHTWRLRMANIRQGQHI